MSLIFFISATEEKTFELGSNVTLTCGNISNLSSSTELSWRKGDNVLLNTTSHNESSLVLINLKEEANGLYVCKANSSQILRSVQLSLATNGEQFLPLKRKTREERVGKLLNNWPYIDPLHKWSLNLNNKTLYVLSLIFMFQDKAFFT